MDIATISILIMIIGCIVGLAEFIRIIKNDSSLMVAQIRTLETKVDHVEEELIELKHNMETIEAIVQKAIEEKIINEKTIALIQEKLKIQESVPLIKK